MIKRFKTILLVGSSVDGKVATSKNGNSKEFGKLLSEDMSTPIRELREWADAVIVSRKTVLNDNPSLTSPENPDLVRIVIDRKLRLQNTHKIFDNEKKTIIITQDSEYKEKAIDSVKYIYIPDTKDFFMTLKKKLISENLKKIMIEGGGNFNSILLRNKFIDKFYIAYFPFIIGGEKTPTVVDGTGLKDIELAYKLELESSKIYSKNMVFNKYNVRYRVDPLQIKERDISNFKKEYNLREIPMLKAEEKGPYFLKRKLLKYNINITKKELNDLLSGKKKKELITGFGITGPLHLGSKLLFDEICWLSNLGHEVSIFLSLADGAYSKVENIEKRSQSLTTGILRYLSTNSVNLFKNHDSSTHPLFSKITSIICDEDFEEIYGSSLKNSQKVLIDMATSVCQFCKNKKVYVLLGIDEIKNARFILKVATKLNLETPGFLFNEIIHGYDGNKMGKSRPSYSLRLDSDPTIEFEKILKYSRNDLKCNKCPLHDVHRFSKSGNLIHSNCNICKDLLKKVIENNIKEWNNSVR